MYSPRDRRSHPRKALQAGFSVTGLLLISAFVLQTGAGSLSPPLRDLARSRAVVARGEPRSPVALRYPSAVDPRDSLSGVWRTYPINPLHRDDYERYLLERYVGMRLDSTLRHSVPYDTTGAASERWKLLAEVREAVSSGAAESTWADSGRWVAWRDTVNRSYEKKVDSLTRAWGDSVRVMRLQDSLRWLYERQLDSALDAWEDSLRIEILQESIRAFRRRSDSAATDTSVTRMASVPPAGPSSRARPPGGGQEFVDPPQQGVGLLLSVLVLCAFGCFAGALYLAVASRPVPASEGTRHALPPNGVGSFLLRGGFAAGGVLLLLLAITPVIACTLVVPPPKRVVQIALLYVSGAVGLGFLWLRYHEFETTNDILQWISSAVALPNLIAAVLLPE